MDDKAAPSPLALPNPLKKNPSKSEKKKTKIEIAQTTLPSEEKKY